VKIGITWAVSVLAYVVYLYFQELGREFPARINRETFLVDLGIRNSFRETCFHCGRGPEGLLFSGILEMTTTSWCMTKKCSEAYLPRCTTLLVIPAA